jgi:hypothetical protein
LNVYKQQKLAETNTPVANTIKLVVVVMPQILLPLFSLAKKRKSCALEDVPKTATYCLSLLKELTKSLRQRTWIQGKEWQHPPEQCLQ